jgi:iron complex transport system permease protein
VSQSAELQDAAPRSSLSVAHGKGFYWRVGTLATVTLFLFLGELSVGEVIVPFDAVVSALFGLSTELAIWKNIVTEFRLPRALNAIASGAALGAAGVMLQTLFRNPLADPFILGLVHAARLGSALLVVATALFGATLVANTGLLGDVGLAAASVAGCILILAALSLIARRVSTVTLLICGLMLGYLAVGLISALLHFVDENQARAFKAWDDASFAGATWTQLTLVIPAILAGLALAQLLAKSLNGFLLGEAYAQSLGVSVSTVKRLALSVIAWLCGVVTAFCGPVAFLGLVAAQLARGIFSTSDHRLLLPLAAWIGANVALAADLVTHFPLPHHVFHLNAVIGLVGAPIALFVLLRSRSLRAFEV